MNIKIFYVDKNNQSVTNDLNNIPLNSVYEEIGKFFPLIAIPSILEAVVTDNFRDYIIRYDAKQRGSYIKDGVTYPSMYVTVKKDELLKSFSSQLDFSHLKECYLTCINPESNNYKYYHMKPTTHGIEVDYGRIGLSAGEAFGKKSVQTPYEPSLYWVRYYEKLSKGYIDNSSAYLTVTPKRTSKKKNNVKSDESSVNTVSEAEASLYNILFAYSKNYIKTNLISETVTVGQVSNAKKIFKALCERKTVKGFNSQLMKLMQISPRRVRDISTLLAHKESDFSKIIDREESLILSMEAMLSNGDTPIARQGGFNNKIEVYVATDKQKEEVMNHLSPELRSKVDTVYRVIPVEQKKRFDKYLADNNIKVVKQLWHGSKNENWLSIIENSLSLSVGVAHGRMFGDGLYFAPSSMKSWGYTSYYGTYWARGNCNTAFMGLYAVAYGKPIDVHYSQRFNETELKRMGCNCVHAHAGPSLRNDEIIFYNEDSIVLNYIVKFK
jgi:poly [ADP-ribose] polymerase